MTAPDKPGLSNEELKPEVQAALSGGGDERWEKLKAWLHSHIAPSFYRHDVERKMSELEAETLKGE